MGNTNPAVQYGITLNGSYKGFDLSVFLQGITKRDVYSSYYVDLNNSHTMNYTADYDPYIDGSGSEPRPVNIDGHGNNYESSRHLENGAYFRLKNLQLGYTVPWNRVQNLRIFVAGQNLFTITSFRGLDPEFTGGVLTPGIDPMDYPNVRTLSAGINVTF
jgi:hypothetical protein